MSITQTVHFTCAPDKVYAALTDSAAFAAATGQPADIGAEEGNAFSCFGGQITGRQIELNPDARIVQAWRAGPWPEGVYSVVRFDLAQEGDGTAVTMEHSGFPAEMAEHLEGGWHKMYWEPLTAHLE